MDWDSRPASIFTDDVADIPVYEPRVTKVAQIVDGELKSWDFDPKDDEKQMKDWLTKVSTTRDVGTAKGVYIIFAGQNLNAQTPPDDYIPGLRPNHQKDFPFSAPTFEQICQTFRVNTSIVRAINRPESTFSRSHFKHESVGGKDLISYNLLTHSTTPSLDLAMSVTTIPTQKQTYVLIYGCSLTDTTDYLNRLRQCGEAYQHPLLLPGIFVELQRIKHKDLVRSNIAQLRGYVLNLSLDTLPKGHRGVNASADAVEIWERVNSDKVMMETWMGMLGKMVDAVAELESEFYGEDEKVVDAKIVDGKVVEGRVVKVVRDVVCRREGRRIGERVGEIRGIYDELARKCGGMIEGTTMANSTVWSRLAQRDSKQMKSIALLTMIFLPATFIASFFAMPLFNWRPDPGAKVVSTYIWIYVVVTVVLTILVVTIWWRFSKNPPRSRGDEEDFEGANVYVPVNGGAGAGVVGGNVGVGVAGVGSGVGVVNGNGSAKSEKGD